MSGLHAELESTTPLFLGGSDPRGHPELRASSVRGALRFWLRALLGGVMGDRPEDLYKAEATIFGNTQGASCVVVRITGSEQSQAYRPLLHNPGKTFTLQGIKPGQKITLTLLPRLPSASIPEAALGALLTFVLLGGLGKRSRRGFGSLAFCSAEKNFPLPLPDYSTTENFLQRLPDLIHAARKAVMAFLQTLGFDRADPSALPHFAILHEQHAKVLFFKKPFQSWEEAMKSFWSLLRSNSYRDNPVFGFAGSSGRQSSPLHLRIVKVGGSFHLLITAFRVGFQKNQPDYAVMDRFLCECQKKWEGKRIFGSSEKW